MRKIKYLNGLRGLAALQVVFHHFILAFYPALFSGPGNPTHLPGNIEASASGSILNIFWDGNFAVCIFFVLSGFVLSHKFFVYKENKIITESAAKRYFRLALPAVFSVFLAYVLMRFSLFYNQPAGNLANSGWLASFWTFQPNFWNALYQGFIGTFFTNAFDYNAVLWTIAWEFSGSFLVFAFLAIFGRSKNRFWVYIFLILVFSQSLYLAFILGMLLSDVIAHRHMIVQKFDRYKVLRIFLLLLGLFLGSYPAGRNPQGTMYAFMNQPFLSDPVTLYHVLGAFFLMIALLDSQRMQRFFSFKFFLFLGEISYAMYLLHFIILGSFSSFIFLKLEPIMAYHYAFLLCFAVSLALIFTASYAVYEYIDKKSIGFSHLFYAKFFSHSED